MKFKVNYCYKDYYEAQKLFYNESKAKWFFRFIGICGLMIIFLCFTTDASFTMENLFWIFVSMLFLLYPQVTLRVTSYLGYKSSKHVLTPTQFEFDKNGVYTTTESLNSEIKWSYFEKFSANKKVLLLSPYSRVFTFLPRRVVDSAEDWKNLIILVKNKMQEKNN